MLHGRGTERAAIDELVAAVRAGASRALVLRGEAGVGKSALLDHAAAGAGMRMVRATGAEPEASLAFAALHQLLSPVSDLLDALPEPQRDAVRGALGLAAAPSADARFLLSAGVLSLLTEAAVDGGLLCVIDDFQWFDRASADAVLFAARRLREEGVGMLLAVRDHTGVPVRDIPELRVGGLDEASAAKLLVERAAVAPSGPVLGTLVALCGGNPLALGEAAASLTTEQLTGRAPLPDPLPVGSGISEVFGRQADELPELTRRVLLIAAAEGSGELGLVLNAAERLGCDDPAAALAPAESAGLVIVAGASIRFRHPLVRSAVYATADSVQRRAAHNALAGALGGDLDRRAWHRAAASVGPDETVAAELAASAERARERGGYADAGVALARAAELTPDRAVRARRLTDAATASWLGGRPGQAETCLAEARELADDPRLLAELTQLRGRFELHSGDAAEAQRVFTEGAERAKDTDPGRALEMLADAAEAAGNVGDHGALADIGRRAASFGGGDPFLRAMLVGIGAMIEGDAEGGVPVLRAALATADGLDQAAHLLWASAAAGQLGDIDASAGYIIQAGRVARVSGMTGQFPVVLEFVARAERLSGRFTLSAAINEEGLALAREAGYTNSAAAHLANLAVIAAVQGRADDCERQAREALAIAIPHRVGLQASVAMYALGLLDLTLGRFAAAHARFESMVNAGLGAAHPISTWRSSPDRIEAAVGCGELDAARSILTSYGRWAANALTPQAQALVARCRALLAGDADKALAQYEEALRLHATDGGADRGSPFEEARSSLLYGERLRRSHRGGDARGPLRTAMETFQRLGLDPWAERAHNELRAAGESVARPEPVALNDLTPQELRIARLVAEGVSNREVAARLFLSPRTVEYHLYKIYPKLGISSRTELARLIDHGVGGTQ
ncbi:helix-turn-helix transcriptional regulator [Actinomadura rudentiformis]|uniref:AAA family ATPase n=1 Tax=Actinomadura rudentiformis TaxID=359158 RepID=A0A6H9Z2A6_9ACTN|nr:helix-turn-helix transcriptional regulator [Actinomadura rudentiformis]KAB2350913.1 AAA family ATPase [Actinomadura rudentiformis]